MGYRDHCEQQPNEHRTTCIVLTGRVDQRQRHRERRRCEHHRAKPSSPRMTDETPARARYVFTIVFRLEPTSRDLGVQPATFETTLFREADPPGEPGWRFFRDNLWRGEVNHPEHFGELAEDGLGVPVDSVAFRELRTTEPYLEQLRAAVADDLQAFNADDVDEVLNKYLGSSIHVVPPEDL